MRIHLVKTAAGSTPLWMLPVSLLDCVELTYHSVIELTLRHLMVIQTGSPLPLASTIFCFRR